MKIDVKVWILVLIGHLALAGSRADEFVDHNGAKWNCEWHKANNWEEDNSSYPVSIKIIPPACKGGDMAADYVRPAYRCGGPVICTHTRVNKFSKNSETFIQNFSPICDLPESKRCSDWSAASCLRNATRKATLQSDQVWDKQKEPDFISEYNEEHSKLLGGRGGSSVNEASIIAPPRKLKSSDSH